ncbi:hypothetical protein C2G38_2210081 [Gigaspora rosea]|uniref:Uncharacterized protein n=1 Tax=Gigaspora rosea TaxID=44941 RepID=A0A397UFP0_9GLOM|nr:hypothetical protein C2G38_2210081 [Gigaspora rosea]
MPIGARGMSQLKAFADPLISKSKKHVWANLAMAGWQIHPRVDEEDLSTYTEITYIVDIDIKIYIINEHII